MSTTVGKVNQMSVGARAIATFSQSLNRAGVTINYTNEKEAGAIHKALYYILKDRGITLKEAKQ